MKDRLLRLPEVIERTGLKRSTIYKYINLGKFPPSKGGTVRLAAWRESDISAWIKTDEWPPSNAARIQVD